MTKTYCIESKPAPGRLQRAKFPNVATGIFIHNRVFSDRQVGHSIVPELIEHPADVSRKWRRACRKTEPETEGVNVATVLARFEAQRSFTPPRGMLADRRLPLAEAARRILSQRQRRRLREIVPAPLVGAAGSSA